MFRRSSSSKLSRSKSTSSAHSKHEAMNPHIARQHAHVAAQLAYTRAQERSSTDMGHRRIQSRTRNEGGSWERQPYSQQPEYSTNGEHVVKRQQSVRFAGPNAVPKKPSHNNRASQGPIQHRASTSTLRPVAMTTSAPVPAIYRPPSRSSSIGRTSMGNPTAESFATALQAYDEYYTQESEIPSTPSSYRRLRKSKSMFSPLKAAPHVFYSNGTPDRDTCSSFTNRESMTEASQTPAQQGKLRAPKSMSFLRGGPGGGIRHSNDEAVQMARDRFFQQATQERLRSQPSFIFRSRTQKSEKGFRKSVRSSSGNSDALLVGYASQEISQKDSKLRDKARKASKTLKLTFKRVFGRSKEEPVAVPNQQVDARETHVRHHSGGPDVVEDTFVGVPYPEDQELSRVMSRVPSLHKPGSAEYLQSQVGSVRSARSGKSEQSDDGSRVTSWTSTAVNTINSQALKTLSEREQQRLSIINENGTHNSSSSFKGGARSRLSAYPTFNSQNRNSTEVLNPLPQPPTVDSARVYSALMKRLDENSPKAVPPLSTRSSVDSMQTAKYAPRRSASVKRGRQPQKYPTIRHVPYEDSIDESEANKENYHHGHHWVKSDSVHAARAENIFGFTGEHTHQWVPADPLREARMRSEDADDVFYGGEAPADHNLGRAISNARRSIVSIDQPSNTTTFYTVPEENGRTPQELAILNEPVIVEPKRIRESRSTFFGGTSITVSKTTSPYRRALAERQSSVKNPNTEAQATCASNINNPLLPGSDNISTVVDHVENPVASKADTESLYSRTTSGHAMAANSALSLLINEQQTKSETDSLRNSNTGDAVIIDRKTYRPSMPASISSHHSKNSSIGSNEWKSWMSSEVAKLERAKDTRVSRPYVNYALPTMPKSFPVGHVRENAQYDDEEVQLAERKAVAVKLPLGMVHPQNINIQQPPHPKPILKKASQVSLNENHDPRHFSTSNIHIPLPPPIPARSPLRSKQSRASLRSVHTITPGNSIVKASSVTGRNVLHKKYHSSATLRSVKSFHSTETPAKLVKKSGRLTPGVVGGPSPGFVDGSTGSVTPRRYCDGAGRWSEEDMNVQGRDEEDVYSIDGAGLLGPDMCIGMGLSMGELSESDAQAVGSRKMVELFLSSRRRRIGGSEEDGSGGGGGGAFL
ncbi:hypothetical protein GLAREA_09084 [Glarea lozoyensis ATCC 20868]|uniref:Uncharacterized protein n=1 Tax=Glarea lozoyensis (strain ATCC 20868 / MF5171) TaxID=1116229 RepID=S3DYB7_GLAL2|nr:uncharacterized protein GLAREA_09084 [Glarea lozoyensis ATCC 20868]EPE36921.1 hypothetical protein GLAREA_09084 [Glarea lozoyensis ATCC 20868]